MPSIKLTKALVNSLGADKDKDVFWWDTTTSGFGLKITPRGKKVWVLQYRPTGEAQAKRLTLGPMSDSFGLAEARAAAQVAIGSAASGEDPSKVVEPVQPQPQGMTFNELFDVYLREGSPLKKEGTKKMDVSRINCHLRPTIGHLPVASLTRAQVEALMVRIAEGETATARTSLARPRATSQVKGGKGAATRTIALLGAVMAFAIGRDIVDRNPCTGVKRFKDRMIERYLTDEEMARLGEALADFERCGYWPLAGINAVRFIALTGVRRNEALTLEWTWIDFERGQLRLPDSKTGKKIVPLGTDAVDFLRSLPRHGRWVFMVPSGKSYYGGMPKLWTAIRKRAELPDVRLHDLRHNYASIGATAGSSLLVIGKILGHASQATTQRYAHLSESPVNAAANAISSTVARAMAEGQTRAAKALAKLEAWLATENLQ